jgi:F-type H+-transporting ATPase subunit epsilon
MSARKLTLRVITPDRILLDTRADAVRVPAADGSMGFLPKHAHLVAALDVGMLTWRDEGKEHSVFVSGGFVEVQHDTVRVVSDAGERPEEIDVERAKEAERKAREKLDQNRQTGVAIDILKAELDLRRAMARLRAAGEPRI